MVGVAGKSQACNTCRQKRLKCDLGRPSCRKCIRSKRVCGGYGRDVVYVNRTPSSLSTTATSVLSEIRAHRQLREPRTNPTKVEADLRSLFSESSQSSLEFRKYAVDFLKTTYLPASSSFNEETSERGFSWAYRLADLMEPSKVLDTSLFAFCLAQLHVTGTSNTSLYECLDQYNTALKHLNFDIADPERRFREETLAAIIVLSTCEIFVRPTDCGWGIHARGIAELLRLRDPGIERTSAWRHLISRMRIVCTLEALTKRHALILRSDTWRCISAEPDFNGAVDKVFRMAEDIPHLLEQAAALPSISDQSNLLHASADVATSMLAKAKSIEFWLDGFLKASPSPRFWAAPSCAANPADIDPTDKTFPHYFEFESIIFAVPVVMCWSLITQLYSNVIQIHNLAQARLGRHVEVLQLLPQANTTVAVDAENALGAPSQESLSFRMEDGHSIRHVQSEGTRMARYICQSLEYFHRTEMGTFGCHASTYPSWSARQYFRLNPCHEREWLWIQNMHKTEGSGTRWGMTMMVFADIVEPLGGF